MARKKHHARLMKEEKFALTPGEQLILFYRENPVLAAKDLLGIDLIWLQRIMLREMWIKRFACLSIGRGVSKSFMFSVFCILKALLYPNSKVGIVTPTYRQVKDFIFDEYIRPWSKVCPFLKRAIDGNVHVGTDRCFVRFRNGAYVEGLPVGHDGGKVRGRRYHIVCADEYAQHIESVLKRAIRPMLNIKHPGRKNQYHIASSPYFKSNHFWPQYLHMIKKAIEDPDNYAVLEFDYRDVNMTTPSKWIPEVPYEVDEEMIEMQRNDQTEEEFAMENLARFPDETTGFFPSRLIDFASPRSPREVNGKMRPAPVEIELKGDPLRDYYVGLDAGRAVHGANFALAILKRDYGRTQHVRTITLNGATYQEMTHTTRRVLRDYNVLGIAVGHGGGGTTMKDLLAVEYVDPSTGKKYPPLTDPEDEMHALIEKGVPIVNMVKETNELNNFMYPTLKSDMEHERFVMPVTGFGAPSASPQEQDAHKEIQRTKTEMLVIEAEPTSQQGFRFTVPDRFQKDRITAVVLANYLINEKFKQIEPKEEDAAVGFWVNLT